MWTALENKESDNNNIREERSIERIDKRQNCSNSKIKKRRVKHKILSCAKKLQCRTHTQTPTTTSQGMLHAHGNELIAHALVHTNTRCTYLSTGLSPKQFTNPRRSLFNITLR